ncbi:hypothetical protein LJC27_06425 [Christensenellaceae bacterium OttesenSCG-928-M15]|nr:hypothetical protein [Christensenellaceae bacterium OttesenSCG-928-M15]
MGFDCADCDAGCKAPVALAVITKAETTRELLEADIDDYADVFNDAYVDALHYAKVNLPADYAKFKMRVKGKISLVDLEKCIKAHGEKNRKSDGVYHYDITGDPTFTTGSKGGSTFRVYEGKCMIGPIDPGTYTVRETKPGTGYASAEDITITVTTANTSSNPAKGSMTNAPLAFEVVKLDGETKQPVAGSVFKLVDSGGAVKVSPITGKPGWYRPDRRLFAVGFYPL